MRPSHLIRRPVYLGLRLLEFLRVGSAGERDRQYLEDLRQDEGLTFLVSFPRTGSHWLRMLVEDYTGRPTMRRTFYHPLGSDPVLFHTHDLDLDVEHPDVIYLYRDPVPTIHSQLRYHGQSPSDRDAIEHWATLYGAHLGKWLDEGTFTDRKTVLRYEEMQEDLDAAFRRVLEHLGHPFERDRFEAAKARVTREEVDRKTRHDPNVVNKDASYYEDRERFRKERGQEVRSLVREARENAREPPAEVQDGRS